MDESLPSDLKLVEAILPLLQAFHHNDVAINIVW
jgi:hypothetical protein